MSNRATRRAALGAILAAPLASVPAAAGIPAAGVSPELARLIRKSQRADDCLRAQDGDEWNPGNIRAAAALRCRVAKFRASGIADVLAKAKHTVAVWGYECAQEEFEAATAEGFAYVNDMAIAVALDLARLAGEDAPCA